ncbi:DUF4037 domain-containing protein [Spirillospora sp. NBC_01491]|uniref:DUF4037 domain-containing protein n=1 Tax=Spirillospora sp. NBC_01491 TaxID=2976007 RepID=UPI002E335BE1|nr:DUF4037 domain-containing protein [Spirillospora sp. NBC_01491]
MDERGAELARGFYEQVVGPILDRAAPRLRYAAARLGSGSDVLGLDDAMSRDHDWGCRLTLLVDDPGAVAEVDRLLERELPGRYRGHPVRFPVTWDAADTHNVEVATVAGFARSRLGVDPVAGLTVPGWLCLTGQGVLEVTAGPVFADRTETLGPVREALRWYPPDVGLYVLAAWWRRVSRLMPMVGRTADRGDDLGSRMLAAKLTADLMALAFALSGRWAPYGKWRGTVFRGLPVADDLAGPFERALAASGGREREAALAAAAERLLDEQRALGLPAPAAAVAPFWDRPYPGIDDAVWEGLRAAVRDPEVACLPLGAGSVEQWVDNVDVLTDPARRAALQAAYLGRWGEDG